MQNFSNPIGELGTSHRSCCVEFDSLRRTLQYCKHRHCRANCRRYRTSMPGLRRPLHGPCWQAGCCHYFQYPRRLAHLSYLSSHLLKYVYHTLHKLPLFISFLRPGYCLPPSQRANSVRLNAEYSLYVLILVSLIL
jgi:hypothetical protein